MLTVESLHVDVNYIQRSNPNRACRIACQFSCGQLGPNAGSDVVSPTVRYIAFFVEAPILGAVNLGAMGGCTALKGSVKALILIVLRMHS